jgi:vancomycin resistance protein YoaR
MNKIIRPVFIGLAVFFLLILLAIGAFQVVFSGRIFPGVSVSGIEVGGLTPAAAAKLLGGKINYPQTGKLALTGQGMAWQATPSDIGVYINLQDTASNAFAVGRTGSLVTRLAEQFGSVYYGHPAALAIILDQRSAFEYLTGLAKQIDVSETDAGVSVQGTQVVVRDAVTGIHLDREASLKTLTGQVQTLSDGVVPLTITEVKPIVIDVGQQAEQARNLLAEPFLLTLPAGESDSQHTFSIQPGELAAMLDFQPASKRDDGTLKLELDPMKLTAYLTQIANGLKRQPLNTRFTFNDTTRQLEVIQPAVIGRDLDISATQKAIREKINSGGHSVDLVFRYTKPAVTDDMTGVQLGITELTESQTSYFRGSSSERISNIKTAAGQFHGLLIAPGENFSMASALGNISLDNGYTEALIIVGDKTIKGVGGGVCQVSSTLFRTVFFAGLPITERHPHAYRVGYYEQTSGGHDPSLAGLDATVFVPLVDFKFTNDTPYWILMETYTSPTYGTLTWKFYSTRDGRTVQWSTSGPTNIVEPPDDLYRENPDLQQGEIKQLEYRAQGAEVTVNREVTRDGKPWFSDSYFTHYEPWQAIFEYGPGTVLPTPTPSP